MTQRLPVPGSDDGDWGDILNGFLEIAHNSNGTLNTSAVSAALPTPIPTSNLGSGSASVTTYLRGDNTWSTPAFVDLTSDQTIDGTKTFEGTITMIPNTTLAIDDDVNISLGTVDGTKFGTGTTQKLGFYNATPVSQPTGDVLTAVSSLGLISGPTLSGSDVTGPVPKRVATLTVSSNTYTPNCTTTDIVIISSPAANYTVANPTGIPTDGQQLTLRIATGSTSYTPSWGTKYVSSGVATVPVSPLSSSKTCTLTFTYDNARTSWVLFAFDSIGY